MGYCDDPARAPLGADDAVERQGCAVFVTRRGDRFEGGTVGPDCASTMSGAAYATSEVVVRADGFASWDRGYNAEAMQVWGAVAGPYEFERRSPIEP